MANLISGSASPWGSCKSPMAVILLESQGLGEDGRIFFMMGTAASTAQNKVLLPSLRVTTFHNINFRGFHTVLDFLRGREKLGCPLIALRFEDCSGLSRSWLQELRVLCPKVDWDEMCVVNNF